MDLLGVSAQTIALGSLESDPLFGNPVALRARFRAIFVAPGLAGNDYVILDELVRPGGLLAEFVALGGSAVINVAGQPPEQALPLVVAPGGATYEPAPVHDAETIVTPSHPYFTGIGFGGIPLGAASFAGWAPADRGSLTTPEAVLLRNGSGGKTVVEYPYGLGKVIVTTLNFCASGPDGPDRPALQNLIMLGRFFQGTAQTPAATLTLTSTPTETPLPPTGTVTNTPTVTRTASPTPSTSATPVFAPGDVDRDGDIDGSDLAALIHLIFAESRVPVSAAAAPPEADVNADGYLTAADIAALLAALGRR